MATLLNRLHAPIFVSHAAGRLQENGLISYVRGRITILDRRGLEAAVCECYKVVKDEYERLLV